MGMFMVILITIALLILWDLTGQFGFYIWRTKIIDMYKPKLATKHLMLNMRLSIYKSRFRLAGPVGLSYALNHYKKNIKETN